MLQYWGYFIEYSMVRSLPLRFICTETLDAPESCL